MLFRATLGRSPASDHALASKGHPVIQTEKPRFTLFPGVLLPTAPAAPTQSQIVESSPYSAQLAGSSEVPLQWYPRSSMHHSGQYHSPPLPSSLVCRSSADGRRRSCGRRAGVREASRRRRYPFPHAPSTRFRSCCRTVVCCRVRSRR